MKIASILSLAVALCVVSSDAAGTQKPRSDPCSDLAAKAKDATSELPYKTVKGCYEAQAFNRGVAQKTIASLESLLSNFYAFTDIAKDPTHAPFETPRVDLLGGLKKIGAKKWKSDYDFQMALYYHLASVNDGHLAYLSKHLCFALRHSLTCIAMSLLESHRTSVSVLH